MPSLNFTNMAELRANLIGNKDLKYKLFRDVEIISSLKDEFSKRIFRLMSTSLDDPEYAVLLDGLEHQAVVIKMICSFSQEVDSTAAPAHATSGGAATTSSTTSASSSSSLSSFPVSSTPSGPPMAPASTAGAGSVYGADYVAPGNSASSGSSHFILNNFESSIAQIALFFKYYMEAILPLIYKRDARLDTEKFERITNDLLDITFHLLNHTRFSYKLERDSSRTLWRWITTLSVISPGTSVSLSTTGLDGMESYSSKEAIFDNEALFLKSLKLVPLLLFDSKREEVSKTDEFNFNYDHEMASVDEKKAGRGNEDGAGDDDGDDDYSSRIMTLVSVLLRRLNIESEKIYYCHFPDELDKESVIAGPNSGSGSRTASGALDSGSSAVSNDHEGELHIFKDPNLPNIEPSIQYFKKSIDVERLMRLICCIAQIFSFIKENGYVIEGSSLGNSNGPFTVLPPKVYLSLLLLLKYENVNLNLVTLNLIYFYLNNLSDDEKLPLELIFKNYQKLFPRINELLSAADFYVPTLLMSPCKILAELCTRYPLINNDIRRANLDIKLIGIMENLFKNSRELRQMRQLKKQSAESSKIIDTSKITLTKMAEKNENLSDLILLLSVYSSKKEEYRSRIVQQQKTIEDSKKKSVVVSFMIFEIIDNYRFLLHQIQMVHMKIRKVISTQNQNQNSAADLAYLGKLLSSMISLLNDSIYTNTFCLIRSLSRSVALLRTFFVECNSYPSTIKRKRTRSTNGNGISIVSQSSSIVGENSFITNLTQILKGIENSTLILNYYSDSIINSKESIVLISRSSCTNKSILLGILANFVLDFSALRYSIVNDEEFLQTLVKIFRNSFKPQAIDAYKSKDELSLQMNTIQYNTLQVLQNYTYNENDDNKQFVMEHYKFEYLFDKITYGMILGEEKEAENDNDEVKELKLKQKVISFDIIRNLTSGSEYFSQLVQKKYNEWRKLKSDDYSYQSETGIRKKHFENIGWYSFLYRNLSQNLSLYGIESGGSLDDTYTLMQLCKNENYSSLFLAINYIEDHKYTNIEDCNDNLKYKERLFKIWLSFLDLTISKEFEEREGGEVNSIVRANNNLSSIQVSICWIIINLTWKKELFGSRRSDSVQFKIYDTVSIGRVNDRIDIGGDTDEEDEGAEEHFESKDETGNDHIRNSDTFKDGDFNPGSYATPTDRAHYLRDFGFLSVLDRLVKRLNGGRFSMNERFDSIMGNDLLEKARNAKNQMLELTGNKNPGGGRRRRRSDKKDPEEKRAFDQSGPASSSQSGGQSNSSGLVNRPDVNRGGEGYGYETDSDEYVDTVEHNESDEEMIDEFDECWIR